MAQLAVTLAPQIDRTISPDAGVASDELLAEDMAAIREVLATVFSEPPDEP